MSEPSMQRVATAQFTTPEQRRQESSEQSSPIGGAISMLRQRVIDLRALPPWLRALVLAGVGLVALTVVLLALRDDLGPGVSIGSGVEIPGLIAIAAFAITLIAWNCILTGALHAHWSIALITLVVYMLVSGAYLFLLDWGSLSPLERLISAAPIVPLTLMWVWALVVQIGRARARAQVGPHVERVGRTFVILLILQILYYSPWLLGDVLIVHKPQATALFVVSEALAFSITGFLAYFLNASSITDAVASTTGRIGGLAQQRIGQWALVALTTVAALGVMALYISQNLQFATPFVLGVVIVLSFLVAIPVALLIVLIARLARLGGNEPGIVPLWALIVTSIVLVVALNFISLLSDAKFVTASEASRISLAVVGGILPLILALAIGVPALLFGRKRGGALRTVGLYFCLLATLGLADAFPFIIELFSSVNQNTVVLHIPSRLSIGIEALGLNNPGVQFVVAIATLITLVVLAVRRQLGTRQATRILGALLILNVGMQAIVWLDQFYQGSSTTTPLVLEAAIILAGFVWSMVVSGETTNVDGRVFSRATRVLIYLGYTLLITVGTLLVFAPANDAQRAELLAVNFGSATAVGLDFMGVPLLFTLAVITIANSRNEPAWPVSAPTPAVSGA